MGSDLWEQRLLDHLFGYELVRTKVYITQLAGTLDFGAIMVVAKKNMEPQDERSMLEHRNCINVLLFWSYMGIMVSMQREPFGN